MRLYVKGIAFLLLYQPISHVSKKMPFFIFHENVQKFFCHNLLKTFSVPLEVPWDDFDFCQKFAEIIEYEIVSVV